MSSLCTGLRDETVDFPKCGTDHLTGCFVFKNGVMKSEDEEKKNE